MSAQHTPGLLVVRGYSIYTTEGTPVADTCLTTSHPDNDHANALRLAACWNACEGLNPDELARFGLGVATGSEIHKLREQRDELLQLLEHAKHLINISTGKKSKLRAMGVIDEAIAKATKESP